MAANTETDVIRSRRLTLDAALVDTITFRQTWSEFVIVNEDDADILTVTNDGTTPTASGDDMYYVPPQSALVIPAGPQAAGAQVVKVIGAGNVYTITAR